MPRPARRNGSLISGVLDAVSDWAILSFAVWTVFAYVGMATGAKATLLVSLWLATVPLVGIGLVLLPRSIPDRPVGAPAPRPRKPLVAAGVAGGLLSALLVAVGDGIPWPVVWAPAAAAVAVAVAIGRLRVQAALDADGPPGVVGDAVAALVGAGFAVMSLFISNSNADDTFYVNRATAVAQLNHIPVRDVLYSNEQLPPLSGAGLPLDAIHALQGAVARLAGVAAPSVVYYVTPPLATFLATWALWRLLREWAPRRALLCFLLGCTYWIWSAAFDLSAGSFFLARIWQGKVMFVAWMVPTLYVLLTRWMSRPDARVAVTLVGAALASLGFTGSATFATPLICATAGLALLAGREWRRLAMVVGAACVPLVIGLAVTAHYHLSEEIPGDLRGNYWIFTQVFSTGVVGAIGAAGLWLAPWLARAGPPARIATGIAVAAAVLLTPGVIPLLSDVFGLTDTLRRFLWAVPLPAVVGLLAAIPVRRPAAMAVALMVAALMIGFGHPLWITLRDDVAWTSRPVWKMSDWHLQKARAILRRYDGPGPVLADKLTMRMMAMITVEPKTVNPRGYYARLVSEPPERARQRIVLMRLATRGDPPVSALYVQTALNDLRVGLVCIPARKPQLVGKYGLGRDYREAFRISDRLCLARRP